MALTQDLPSTVAAEIGQDSSQNPVSSANTRPKLRTTDEAIRLLKGWEGFSAIAYRDYERPGVWTIGYGSTRWLDQPVKPGDRISREMAEELLRYDLERFESWVNRLVLIELNANEFSALVLLTYNIGPGGLQKSMLLRKLNHGDKVGAANEFLKWNKVKGRVLPGLVRRRRMERTLFLTPVRIEYEATY